MLEIGYWSGGSSDSGVYVPDWNDPDFMARAQALISALAARHADDPRLGWIETGFYGNFAEWSIGGLPDGQNGEKAQEMTDANKAAIIDAWFAAFPEARIIQIVEEGGDTTYGFKYAMGKSPRIGWRYDCLGHDGMDWWPTYYHEALSERWRG